MSTVKGKCIPIKSIIENKHPVRQLTVLPI